MYCPDCGNKLPNNAIQCSQCSKTMLNYDRGSGLACWQCGKSVADDARYCWCCGEEIDKEINKGRDEGKGGEEVKGVGGWLLLLCVSLVIINPLFTVSGIVSDIRTISDFISINPVVVIWLIATIAIRVGMIVVCVYAGIGLLKTWPQAVKTAKICLLSLMAATVVINLTPFLFMEIPPGHLEEYIYDSVKPVLQSAIYVLIWYAYLVRSKRVRNTYGVPAVIDKKVRPAGTD